MKTLKEFEAYCSSTLLAELLPLEKERIGKRNILLLAGTGTFALLIIILRLDFSHAEHVSMILLALLVMFYHWYIKGYKDKFKQDIIKKIVHFIEPTLNYEKDKFIARDKFESSKIFLANFNSYGGDDFVKGKYNTVAIEFSELLVEHVTGGKNKSRHKVFQGLFIIADFNKSFKGETFVLPDRAEKMFGSLGGFFQSHNPSRNQLIKLENEEFEKDFVVYGDDQVEARYILSTSLMERIVTLRKKCRQNISLAFKQARVYIAIDHGKLFEPRVFRTILDTSSINQYFSDLSMALGIIDDLNLNTRIWKQS